MYKEKYLFLLGGYDLEMFEIRKLLEEQKLDFRDKKLSWGAKLSQYKEFLDDDRIIVGIELENDVDLPERFIFIDHHGKNSKKPSSIEQVAEILNIKLNRYQQLVAENDKGYIKAMEKYGATKEEIDEIRKKDRKYQGVTEADEQLAEKSIKENLIRKGDIVVINALTEKFSTITDRIYQEDKILIYTDSELTYYGADAKELWKFYRKKYKENEIYFGGVEGGFFGFSKNAISADDIFEKANEIFEIIEKKGELIVDYYKNAKRMRKIYLILFYIIFALSVVATIYGNDKFINIMSILSIIIILFFELYINDQIEKAEEGRRIDFINNSFNIKLGFNEIDDYFDNEEIKVGVKKMALNTFDNMFFTLKNLEQMLTKEFFWNLIPATIILGFSIYGFMNINISLPVLQLFLSNIFFTRYLRIKSYKRKVEENYKIFESMLERNSKLTKNDEGRVIKIVLDYETTINRYNILLDDKFYKENNKELNKMLKDLKSKLNS